ncbi:MAG: metallophosphoesterase [Bacteroidetes bacterium]|nr:metallophosphoesterase [Bacteroidota bacterium]
MSSNQRNPRTRPVFKLSAVDDQEKFKPVPLPSGKYPYRLNIKDVIPGLPQSGFAFHIVGDTGGTRSPEYQKSVVDEMIRQCSETTRDNEKPQFLFHLGDVVYNFGQASEYYDQFFNPYRDYPCPIFAIPGNHDADVNPLDKEQPRTLDAFETVFCDTESRSLKLARDTGRKSNIQPNFYWVLETPLADIIGLYSNVPKFGNIQKDQREWFIEALKTSATKSKAIIICVHHAPYSADINHGSSIHMMALIDGAAREAKVVPDLVLSGHVHNYQRFVKRYPDKTVPFIVAGGGGYADLHPIAKPDDPDFSDDSCLLDGVELQNYCDDTHGFLKIGIGKKSGKVVISGEYYTTGINQPQPFDRFTISVPGR